MQVIFWLKGKCFISTILFLGATKRKPNYYITKEPDSKVAFVTMVTIILLIKQKQFIIRYL